MSACRLEEVRHQRSVNEHQYATANLACLTYKINASKDIDIHPRDFLKYPAVEQDFIACLDRSAVAVLTNIRLPHDIALVLDELLPRVISTYYFHDAFLFEQDLKTIF